MTIEGHGATLQVPSGTVRLRFFYIGADPAAPGTWGITRRARARSRCVRSRSPAGDSTEGFELGGGGAGMGGAIFNHGLLLLDRVTLQDNRASGGNTVRSVVDNVSGGGMGQEAPFLHPNERGGGFGGPVSPAGSRLPPSAGDAVKAAKTRDRSALPRAGAACQRRRSNRAVRGAAFPRRIYRMCRLPGCRWRRRWVRRGAFHNCRLAVPVASVVGAAVATSSLSSRDSEDSAAVVEPVDMAVLEAVPVATTSAGAAPAWVEPCSTMAAPPSCSRAR